MTFVFSICIPTFCRAADLELTLDSITGQSGFGPDVEIVVIDNASTDATAQLMEKITARHSNVFYKRNGTNIGQGGNIMEAAAHGTGKYLKLLNDNKILRDGVISEWRTLFSEAEDDIIFHYPFCRGTPRSVVLDSDRFVYEISYYLTWLGGFSVKRDAWHRLDLASIDPSTELPLTEAALDLLNQTRQGRLIYSDWYEEPRLPVRSGYNYFEVFVECFPHLLEESERNGCITRSTRRNVERQLLREHIFPFILDSRVFPDHYRLDKGRGFTYLAKKYYSFPEFYLFPLWAAKNIARRAWNKPRKLNGAEA